MIRGACPFGAHFWSFSVTWRPVGRRATKPGALPLYFLSDKKGLGCLTCRLQWRFLPVTNTKESAMRKCMQSNAPTHRTGFKVEWRHQLCIDIGMLPSINQSPADCSVHDLSNEIINEINRFIHISVFMFHFEKCWAAKLIREFLFRKNMRNQSKQWAAGTAPPSFFVWKNNRWVIMIRQWKEKHTQVDS